MSRRAGRFLIYVVLFAACVYAGGCDGCNGTPANFNQITLSATNSVISQGGTTVINATVANDTSNSGVSWTLTGAGTLSGSTKTSVTYNAPASVSQETIATVHASSVEFPSQSSSIQIKVESPVSITTTSLAGGNYGSSYSATINSSGGVPPFTWTVSAGALTPGLALVSSATNAITIAGTPTAQTDSSFTIKIADSAGGTATQALMIAIGPPGPLAVTTASLPSTSLNVAYPATTLQASGGVPPYLWSTISGSLPPGLTLASNGAISGTATQAGNFPFIVQVSDSENPTMTANRGLTISVGNLTTLNGNYAFEFNGFNSNGNAVSIAGSFTADGNGNITNGVEDVNTIGGSPQNQTFTGTYTVSGTNQGRLTFSSLAASPTYSFSINDAGSHGRLIEFDSSGTRGSGALELRSLSTCTATTFNGRYAFGLFGQQMAVTGVSAAGPAGVVGTFAATPAVAPSTQGSLNLAELDADTPVKLTVKDQSLSGTYQASSQATRCSVTMSSTVQASMNFSVYPVSSSEFFMVETDAVSSSSPMLTAGTIQQQIGAPYSLNSGATFTGTSAGALSGQQTGGSTKVPDIALVSIAGAGSNSFTISSTENLGGTVTSNSIQSNFIQADQFGRVATSPTTPFDPVFYMINQNTAFCLGTQID
ncbi:MAG: putative Ig domain-containing protein, partial [Candidatus Acidiferrales bacterium]